MNQELISSLPVFPFLDEIISMIQSSPVCAISAEPGAGKTTAIPASLLEKGKTSGKILLLQPRRLAARASAERISFLLGESVGNRVGLRTRQETIIGKETVLEVVTEGILTRMIQNDQSLEGYGLIIFDEFHERSINSDMGLALALDCMGTLRSDLKIVLMSATLDIDEVKKTLGDIPSIKVPGRTFPVEVSYRSIAKGERQFDAIAKTIVTAYNRSSGSVLVFLPGFREIRITADSLNKLSVSADIMTLHGQMPPAEQREVLRDSGKRRIILSTNVAETSVTIPGVDAVVDSGLVRRVRFNPRTGMDHWDTGRISNASAVQRSGRAGRMRAGIAIRVWDESERLTPFDNPEILEADCAPLVFESLIWGVRSVYDLTWMTPPPKSSVTHAMSLLKSLGICDENEALTKKGNALSAFALHPRFSNMLYEGKLRGLADTAAALAAVLEEDDAFPADDPDLRDRVLLIKKIVTGELNAGKIKRAADEYEHIMRRSGTAPDARKIDPEKTGFLTARAYPERLARKTKQNGQDSRWQMSSGRGAVLKGLLSDEEFLAIADCDGGDADGRIFSAAPVSRADIDQGLAGDIAESIIVSWENWKARLTKVRRAGLLVLNEKPLSDFSAVDLTPHIQRRIAADGISVLPWDDDSKALLARCRYLKKKVDGFPEFSDTALERDAGEWIVPFAKSSGEILTGQDVLNGLVFRLGAFSQKIDKLAPKSFVLPTGNSARFDYESGDVPVLSARLQEFFGCIDTPQVCGEPVLLHLLSPARRPVQITRDLAGFWDRAYPEVKKELMGRYPKHYWPENPREAEPTARAKPRK
jgi:ATP-dependent helicase HrpB